MPAEIDFSRGVRGLHHIPTQSKLFVQCQLNGVFGNTSLERLKRGVDISELVTEILQRDIEIVEALK